MLLFCPPLSNNWITQLFERGCDFFWLRHVDKAHSTVFRDARDASKTTRRSAHVIRGTAPTVKLRLATLIRVSWVVAKSVTTGVAVILVTRPDEKSDVARGATVTRKLVNPDYHFFSPHRWARWQPRCFCHLSRGIHRFTFAIGYSFSTRSLASALSLARNMKSTVWLSLAHQ
jgi:hypothetical protein